jgi:MFS family permease
VTRDRLLTRDFVFIFAANLLHGISFFLFVHLPSFLSDLGASETEIGFLFAVTAIAAIAARPTIGERMDVYGRRPVILVAGAINLVAILLYLTVSSLGVWLYVVRIIHGVSEAAMFTALFTYGADVVPASRRTEGLALFGVSGLLPIALGGLLGDIIVANFGFTALFATAALCAAAAYLIALALDEPERPEVVGERPSFFQAINQPNLMPLWWIAGVFSLVLTGYFTFLRTFVDETGIGTVGLFFAFYAGTAILLRLAFAWLPARVGEKRVLVPAFGALIVGFFVLAGADDAFDIAVAGILCGAGHGYTFPILFGFTVTRAPESVRGSALAFFTALFDIGVLIGGPLLGFIIEVAGYPTMFTLCGVALALATGVYIVWDRRWDAPTRPRVAAET